MACAPFSHATRVGGSRRVFSLVQAVRAPEPPISDTDDSVSLPVTASRGELASGVDRHQTPTRERRLDCPRRRPTAAKTNVDAEYCSHQTHGRSRIHQRDLGIARCRLKDTHATARDPHDFGTVDHQASVPRAELGDTPGKRNDVGGVDRGWRREQRNNHDASLSFEERGEGKGSAHRCAVGAPLRARLGLPRLPGSLHGTAPSPDLPTPYRPSRPERSRRVARGTGGALVARRPNLPDARRISSPSRRRRPTRVNSTARTIRVATWPVPLRSLGVSVDCVEYPRRRLTRDRSRTGTEPPLVVADAVIHPAAAVFQLALGSAQSGTDQHGRPMTWPVARSQLDTATQRLDTAIANGAPPFPAAIRMQLTTAHLDIREGRTQLAESRDPQDITSRTAALLDEGRPPTGTRATSSDSNAAFPSEQTHPPACSPPPPRPRRRQLRSASPVRAASPDCATAARQGWHTRNANATARVAKRDIEHRLGSGVDFSDCLAVPTTSAGTKR
jgi:hypothetical protein